MTALSPAEKVAVLLMAMGEDIAAAVFKNMDPSEVRRIGAALGRMGRVEQATIDIVLHEFLALLQLPQQALHRDSAGFAQRAIQLAFKGEAGERLARESVCGDVRMRVFDHTEAPILARVLRNEQAQTIALVLAHAKPEMASALLRQWPDAARTEILLRMARLNPVDPEMISELDRHLIEEVQRMGDARQQKRGGAKQVAAILNRMDKDGARLLEKLSERNPAIGEEIREKMFTFDDLVMLDSRAFQELVKALPQTTLLLALRGTPDTIQNLFFGSMSQRAAKMLKEDLLAMPPQKIQDVTQAQNDILACVRRLEEEGKIVIEGRVQQAAV